MPKCLVVLLLAAACSTTTPSYAPRLMGGEIVYGWDARKLVEQGGVRWLVRLEGALGPGNAVEVAPCRYLTADHVFPSDTMKLQLGGPVKDCQEVLRGDGHGAADRWVVFGARDRDTKPCQLGVIRECEPNTEAVVVGYGRRADEDLIRPLLVKGWTLPPPAGVGDQAGRLIFLDQGPKPVLMDELAGAAVLVREGPEAPWRLIGIFVGQARLDNGIAVGIAVPLDPQVLELAQQGRTPARRRPSAPSDRP